MERECENEERKWGKKQNEKSKVINMERKGRGMGK